MFVALIIVVCSVVSGGVNAASKVDTVGAVCQSDSQCSINELCLAESLMIPPCSTGKCQCLPNHEIQMDCSFNYSCSPIILNIGDACCQLTSSSVYVTLPPGARCGNDGKVQCRPPFYQNGSLCVSGLNIQQGDDCKTHEECTVVGMICSPDLTCQCPSKSQKFSKEKGHCVKVDFGDPCSDNTTCNAFASTWRQGYTYNSGACSPAGRCYCGDNKEVTVTYLDSLTRELYNKTICVPKSAVVNLGIGEDCHHDPIFYSIFAASVRTCANGLVCTQCLGDGETTLGKCRILLDAVMSPVVSRSPFLVENNGDSSTTRIPFVLGLSAENHGSNASITALPVVGGKNPPNTSSQGESTTSSGNHSQKSPCSSASRYQTISINFLILLCVSSIKCRR